MAKVFPPLEFLTSDRCFRLRPTTGEIAMLRRIEAATGLEFEAYFRPFINGFRPSLALYRPEAGVLLIDFCSAEEHRQAKARASQERPGTLGQELKARFTKQKFELLRLAANSEEQKEHEDALRRAVSGLCVVEASLEEVKQVYGEVKYYQLVALEELLTSSFFSDFLYRIRLRSDTAFPIAGILHQMRRYLKPSLHRLEEGKPFMPNAKQAELMQSRPGRQRVKGVAGSGKTATLVRRAISANQRHKGEVLILCFNITIRHYIKDKLEDVLAEYIRSDFHITHYHDFFKHQAMQFIRPDKMHLGDWEDLDYFKRVATQLPKYATIIVDEAQDYLRVWIEILLTYFLQPDGELIVFFDQNQDIYTRRAVATFPIKGRPHEMLKSYRLSTSISELCNKFLQAFDDNDEADKSRIELVQEQSILDLSLFKGGLSYTFLPKNTVSPVLYEQIAQRMQKMDTTPDDIAILSTSTATLRRLEQTFRQLGSLETTRMLESEEEYQALKSDKTVTDFYRQLWQVRRAYKLHLFNLRTGRVKFSSVQSFKGWEIHTVYLLLTPGEQDTVHRSDADESEDQVNWQVVYTGLTRAKHELNIINLGNEDYHNFFAQEISG